MHAADTDGGSTLHALDDRAILKLYAKTRDPGAFAVLASRYQAMVLATCRRSLGNEADAQDAAQETFLSLAREAGKIRTNAASWLHVCAMRRSVDLIRRVGAQRRAESRAAAPLQHGSPEEMLWADIEPRLDDALAGLRDDERGLLVARYLAGRTQAEVAKELGVSDGTVHRRTKRALERLRAALESSGLVVAGGAGAGVLAGALSGGAGTAGAELVPSSVASSIAKIGLAGVVRPEAVGVSLPTVAAAVIGTVAVLGGAYGIATIGGAPSGGVAGGGVPAVAPAAIVGGEAVDRPRATIGPFEVVSPVYPQFANRGAIIEADRIFIGRNIDRKKGEVSYVDLAIESTDRDGALTVYETRVLEEVNSPGIVDRYTVGQRITVAASVDKRGVLTIVPLTDGIQFGRNQPEWFGVRPPVGWPERADIPADTGPGGVRGPWAAKEWWPVTMNRDEIRFGTDNWQAMRLGVIDWEKADGYSRVMTIYRGGWEQGLIGRRFPTLVRAISDGYELAYYPAFRKLGGAWPASFEFSEENPVHVLRFVEGE